MGSRTKLHGKKRLSRRKSYILRRKLKKLAKIQADLEAQNKFTNPSTSVVLLRDVTNSEINTETQIHCLHQIEKEQMDNNEKKIDAYNEGGVPCETIECCKSNVSRFMFVNVNNLEEIDECNVGGTHNDTIDQSIEYSTNNKDIDNNSVNAFSTPQNTPTGRFIVDFSFMWSEIHRIFNDHARGLNCQFKYWKLVNSHRRGFLTQFFFKCEMCQYEASIWSEPVGTETSDINADVETASLAANLSFTRFRKLLSYLNIIYMPEKINRKH